MQVQLNNLTNNSVKSWERLLETHTHNTVFQSPIMYNFYTKVQNFEPFLFMANSSHNECCGIMLAVLIKEKNGLLGYLSSRVIVYGGPLITTNNNKIKNEVLDLLLKKLISTLSKKSMFIQFRNFFDWDDASKSIFYNNNFNYRDRLNLLVNINTRNEILSNINSTKRRQIKKGLASGAVISSPKNKNEVHEFYKLLYNLYKNKVRKPLPTWSFFKEFYYLSKTNKVGIILLVKYHDKIIGGILSPITPQKNIYEWYVAGLDQAYKKQYPSILATWAPIDYAIKNNLQHFDFMGIGKPTEEYGVRNFKMKFGKKVTNYGRFARRNNKYIYKLVEFAYNLMRILKMI